MTQDDYSQAVHGKVEDKRLNDYVKFCKQNKVNFPDLLGFNWAWNRQYERILKLEAENAMLREQLNAPRPLDPPKTVERTDKDLPYPDITISEMEHQMIICALIRYKLKKSHAAIALGIAPKTLSSKMVAYNIRPEKRGGE